MNVATRIMPAAHVFCSMQHRPTALARRTPGIGQSPGLHQATRMRRGLMYLGRSLRVHPVADPDFVATDAELILRSNDNVDFGVHRVVLQLASPVFRDMLSMPQSGLPDAPSPLPVVEMFEDALSLRILLKFCYPRPAHDEPQLVSLADVKRAATLAHKYDIVYMHKRAEQALLRCDDASPALVFALAWRFGYHDALRISARRTLDIPYFFKLHITKIMDAPEFTEVPATCFLHLYRYHNAVEKQLQPLLNLMAREWPIMWIRPSDVGAELLYSPASRDPKCACALVTAWFKLKGLDAPMEYRVYSWWWEYLFAVVSSMQRDNRPGDIEAALNDPLLPCMKTAMQCDVCEGGSISIRVLTATRVALRRTIEEYLTLIPLPAATARD
ncbi:unnamed protein product [Peniophora sp. CBMAI 1063]|nr:unnamed protein product [Peniophora sp. CBMAI 1063]